MNKRVAPSVELETAIERLLAEGLTDSERLAEIGRLGAQLAILDLPRYDRQLHYLPYAAPARRAAVRRVSWAAGVT